MSRITLNYVVSLDDDSFVCHGDDDVIDAVRTILDGTLADYQTITIRRVPCSNAAERGLCACGQEKIDEQA